MLRLSMVHGPWSGSAAIDNGLQTTDSLLRRKRMLGRVLLREDLVDLRFVLHGALNCELGGLVVVLVDLVVVLGFPVNKHAADDDEVVHVSLGNHPGGNAVGDGL